MILLRLLLLFTIVPMIELYLLLQLAHRTSPWATFALVILTGVVGSYLARREGIAAWRRFREKASRPSVAGIAGLGRDVGDAVMIGVAAALLVTPGILTDLVGFFLLVPAGRRAFRRHLLPRLMAGVHVRTGGSGFASGVHTPPTDRRFDSKVLDGHVVRRD